MKASLETSALFLSTTLELKNFVSPDLKFHCFLLPNLEIFRIIRKISSLSGNFSGYPETFRTIRKISGLSGNFPGYPEIFCIIRKISSLSGNYLKGLETSQCNFKGYAQKLSGRAKTFRMAMPRCHDGFWASGGRDEGGCDKWGTVLLSTFPQTQDNSSQKVFLACTAVIEKLDFTSQFECGW